MVTRLFLQTHRTPVLSDDDAAALQAAESRAIDFPAKRVIVRENVPLTQCTLLLSGFIERFRDTPEGRRQILAIHVPGDFVDLHSYPLKRLEHSVAALTPVTVATFAHSEIRKLTERSATLTELLWRSTLIDAAISREWIVSVGARGASVRLAHLLCEMFVRLERIGMTRGQEYDFPVTQIDLADATGLTAVHANRMLRKLREQNLVEFRQGLVRIIDWPALKDFAEFDPRYLFLD
ncbi:Crp/Fnr family transcriptional regulator [Sphingomonas sp. Leaf357]|uniref:Crp/Fnr family transcriptional regulator n=1 Tax=Sphingomonas sp. Leaf357 TaxID=1736350 RepID=UPI0006FE162D|nr:Crp/Fnr family transcriptional regulator [Sphingomonas sp. Leaf357]KQS04214.1 Crp/Fnr family transcriptional regulator [Sphingomonas sp. Leaf357]